MHHNCNEFLVGTEDSGRRIDRILRIMLPDTSLSLIYKMMRTGKIRLNGKKVKPEQRVSCGDVLIISAIHSDEHKQQDPPIHSSASHEIMSRYILMETPDLLMINKPRGMLTHGPDGLDTLVKTYYSKKIGDSLAFVPAPIHRLDRNTSGLLAVSASLRGAQLFAAALKQGLIKKHYIALLDGIITNELMLIDRLQRDDIHKRSSVSTSAEGQIARTLLRPLINNGEASLVEIIIETGKTHQIRVQCAAHGYPLRGDRKYGGSDFPYGYFLHAWKLESPPDLLPGLPATLTAPIPIAAMQQLQKCFPEKKLESMFLA